MKIINYNIKKYILLTLLSMSSIACQKPSKEPNKVQKGIDSQITLNEKRQIIVDYYEELIKNTQEKLNKIRQSSNYPEALDWIIDNLCRALEDIKHNDNALRESSFHLGQSRFRFSALLDRLIKDICKKSLMKTKKNLNHQNSPMSSHTDLPSLNNNIDYISEQFQNLNLNHKEIPQEESKDGGKNPQEESKDGGKNPLFTPTSIKEKLSEHSHKNTSDKDTRNFLKKLISLVNKNMKFANAELDNNTQRIAYEELKVQIEDDILHGNFDNKTRKEYKKNVKQILVEISKI